jgi:hypothetical protein
MKKTIIILCVLTALVQSQILSLSARERRAMRNDFAILDNAYQNGFTQHFIEFAAMFLERYKLASVDKNPEYRRLFEAVQNAKARYLAIATQQTQLSVPAIIEDDEMQRIFSAVLLSPAEDIIAFAEDFPDFRPRDILGALERARVSDLEAILSAISRGGIPTNEIVRFAHIYGDTASVSRIRTATERAISRNIALLPEYRRIFGITEFDERVELILYNRIMQNSDLSNLIAYITHFPDGRYIRFVSELWENTR